MNDGIIKGEGNSRYLKTVADAMDRWPTWPDALREMIAGTFPFDLNGINAAGWKKIGTAMDKANTLTDDTAALLGGVDTVNEALAVLANDVGELIPSNIVASTYKGTGKSSATITVGFTPRAVFVFHNWGMTTIESGGYYWQYGGLAVTGSPVEFSGNALAIADNGFTVYYNDSNRIYTNQSGYTYNYVAIK